MVRARCCHVSHTEHSLCRFTVGSMIRADFPTERGSDLLWFYIDYCKDTCQFVDLKSCTKQVIVILLQHAASHVRSKEYIYYLYSLSTHYLHLPPENHVVFTHSRNQFCNTTKDLACTKPNQPAGRGRAIVNDGGCSWSLNIVSELLMTMCYTILYIFYIIDLIILIFKK